MAELTLREYIEFIEGRFDREDYRDAVEHSRHILETYPKYVEAYRVLARALLEQEKYQDALDMFQRVLSTDPNDFVAHIGISECYRESNAIEQALWHLERAFEQVPNNQELQEEIKRLYAARGGVGAAAQVPRKIPLTKGALARLYAKGDLYEQAIPELSSAIEDDSERLDLQVLLAETLWRAHEEVKAGRVAAQVLKRLPNSISANRILAQLWLMAGQEKEARPFLLRLRELDPYVAYMLEHPGDAVPPNLFTLTKLDYSSREQVAEQLGWVSEIDGIEKKQGVTGPLPSLPERDTPLSMETPIEPNTPVTPRKPIGLGREAPDWLSDALSDEPAATQPDTDEFQANELRALLGIDDADLPTPPVSVPPIITESVSTDDDGIPSWLEETLTEDTGPNVNMPQLKEEPPDWLQGVLDDDAEAAEPESKVASSADNAVVQSEDVLSTMPLAAPALEEKLTGPMTPVSDEQASLTPTSNEEDSMVPDDMNDEAPDWMLSGDLDSDDALAWLEELAAKYDPDFEKSTGDDDAEAEAEAPDTEAEDGEEKLPETLVMKKPSAAEDMATQPAPPIMDADDDDDSDLPDWLKDSDDTVATPAAEDDLPDWLKTEAAPAAETSEPMEEPPTDPVRPPELASAVASLDDDDDDMPDWLSQMGSLEDADATDDDMDWLRSPTETSEPEPAKAEADEDLPDWLRSSEEEPAAEAPAAVAASQPEAEKASDAMSWLDSQVAEQGVDPDAVVSETLEKDSPPINGMPIPDLDAAAEEPDDEDLPDWLKEASADAEASGKVREADDLAGLTDDLEIEGDGALAWLEGALDDDDDDDDLAKLLAGDDDTSEPEEEKPAEPVPAMQGSAAPDEKEDEELPDWLKGISDDPVESKPTAGTELPDWLGVPSEPSVESSRDDDDLPSWLGDVSSKPAEEPVPVAASADADDDEDLPDWLKGIEKDDQPEPAPALAAAPAPEKTDDDDDAELPDWLKGDSEFDPGDTAVAAVAAVPAIVGADSDDDDDDEAEEADLPDWLKGMEPADKVEEPAAVTISQEDDDELPAWLAGIEEESETPAEAVEALPKTGQLFEPAEEVEDELPAWLQEADEEEPETVEEPEPEPTSAEEEPEAEPVAIEEVEPEPVAVEEEPEPEVEAAKDDAEPAPEPVKETGGLTGWLQAVEPAETLSDMEREIAPPEPAPIAAPAASLMGADAQDYGQWLEEGRNQLEEKNLDLALSAYESLVNSGQLLNETVADLSTFLNKQSGDNPQVRRIIGDALMAQGRLQEALDMYRNALDTL